MARPLRVAVPGAWYHVIARGIERRAIFRDRAYYQKFEELLATLPERFGVRLHTYVLMPNHYHLQIETPRLNLSEAIRWLNISYAVWFNRKTRRNGPLMQGRFKAVVHDPSEAGWTIHEYIHLNPVRVKRFGASRLDHELLFREVRMNLDTLWVNLDEEKLILVWRGLADVRTLKLREIEHIVAVTEPLSQLPRSLGRVCKSV
jgi:REP element-mobilizing transposase RayT